MPDMVTRLFVFALLPALAIGCGSAKPVKPEDTKPRPQPNYKFGADTTLFTVPLDANGYLDFETALNERLRGKIKPEDNAVVLLVQTLGPKPEGFALPESFYRWLEASAPTESGVYLIGNYQYFRDEIDNDQDKSFSRRQSALTKSLWKGTDDPQHADWLKANEKPLALAVEASARPAYYHPLVHPKRDGQPGLLFPAPLPVSAKVRELAYMLGLRATLKAGEGKRTEAWADVFAAFRLARLVSRGGTALESIIAVATEANASEVALTLLEQTRPTGEELRTIREQFRKLPAMELLETKLALSERVSFLELTQAIHRDGLQVLRNLENESIKRQPPDETDEQLRTAIDWEVPFKTFHRWFDRFTVAHTQPTHAERVKAWTAASVELKDLMEKSDLSTIGDDAKKGTEASARSEVSAKFADIIVSRMMPNTRMASEAFYRGEQLNRNLHLAFALAAYYADHKKYPAALADLAPKYIERVPTDLFSGKSLVYKPTDAGYLLYSVGVNGTDDGGKTFGDDPPGDDLRIRMPSAKVK